MSENLEVLDSDPASTIITRISFGKANSFSDPNLQCGGYNTDLHHTTILRVTEIINVKYYEHLISVKKYSTELAQ